MTELSAYYESVAPFYQAEMALRDDIPRWVRLTELASGRTVIDLGCGNGRVARALAARFEVTGVDLLTTLGPHDDGFTFVQADLRALPFADGRFDLAIAANDPFAHLLEDADRTQALNEATRVASRVVIDGLALTPADDAHARTSALVREAKLPGGTLRHETWRALGGDRYRTTYRYLRGRTMVGEATTTVRAWRRDEVALRRPDVHLAGSLDGRLYDPEASGFVISVGGPVWS
jgi:SAM-dependent methyltransferase